LTACGGPPAAVANESHYEAATIQLPLGGKVLLTSDGIIEQPAFSTSEREDQFGQTRFEAFLKQSVANQDIVADLFAAVHAHAGPKDLADDATVVAIRW
jgi:serine phosphatase RsbU (regulator of sigma subunit)